MDCDGIKEGTKELLGFECGEGIRLWSPLYFPNFNFD